MTFLVRHTLAWPTWAVFGVPRRYVSVFPWTLNSDGLASVTFTCFSSLSYVGHTQESGSSCSLQARSSWPCFFPSVPGTVLCWETVRLEIPFSSAVNQAQKKIQKITLKYFRWQLFGMILSFSGLSKRRVLSSEIQNFLNGRVYSYPSLNLLCQILSFMMKIDNSRWAKL